MEADKRIAVIGGGVAGIVSAHILQRAHEVTIFEKNDYLGGHTNTIVIEDGADEGLPVDTGFIVLNDRTYPNFNRFLSQLGVKTRDSDMSFGFYCLQSGLIYGGSNFNGLFAQRKNLFNLRFHRFLLEIATFCREASNDLREGAVGDVTLGDYLSRGGFSDYLKDNYLAPMAAAIWSTPLVQITDFPAGPFLHFFRNHGLLDFRDKITWKTVVGGSHDYVRRFSESFKGTIELNSGIRSVRRLEDGVMLELKDGESKKFDLAVIAAHADQALKMLADPSERERRLLLPWTYQLNRTLLHTDHNILPPLKRAWCSWNFRREAEESGESPIFVTYYMNRLQGLKTRNHYCVTLNSRTEIDPASVIREIDYHHPLYTFESMATQQELAELSGENRTYFCGSYFGYGFHEDAVKSAVAVGRKLGLEL